MTTQIRWGEDDIRDAMAEFDPGAAEFGTCCIRGIRHTPRFTRIGIYAHWDRVPTTLYVGGLYERSFADPIEAIQFALAEHRRLSADEKA